MKLDEASDGKDKPSIDVLPQAPVPHCPLKARVWMLYEQRHIEAGRQFYDESRQRVRFVRDADKKADVEIASADEVSPAVWTLKICHGQCDRSGKDQNLKVSWHRIGKNGTWFSRATVRRSNSPIGCATNGEG